MGSIEEEFAKAVKYVQELPSEGPYKPTNSEKLKFYGLYKQATIGPCTLKKPSIFDMTGRAKWTAWHELHEMPQLEAMTKYVQEFKLVRSKFETASADQES